MSIETWRTEFYPEEAVAVALRGNDIECIEHSIRKWSGVSPENLQKHNVYVRGFRIEARDEDASWSHLPMASETCALCHLADIRLNEEQGDECSQCPIVKATGAKCDSQWHHFETGEGEVPMQQLLQKTLEFLKELK